ncbi:MAG: hypothetical protein HQK76_19815 [Desulfobacterales bacterium]|nr:hypothetical protein [Desulfobacterales bacterium]
MSKFEDHCKESIELFGKSFDEVHKWLDEFQNTERYRMRHRRVRHHESGIKEAISIFGEKAGDVARRHIISDLKEEGWTELDPFPINEEHYVKIGLF